MIDYERYIDKFITYTSYIRCNSCECRDLPKEQKLSLLISLYATLIHVTSCQYRDLPIDNHVQKIFDCLVLMDEKARDEEKCKEILHELINYLGNINGK